MKNYGNSKKTKLRWGFKSEANAYAREFREELGLKKYESLCPWKLAKHLAIPISPLSEFQNQIPTYVNYFTKKDCKSFSAVTIFDGWRRLIIHNDSHNPYRQASNIMHELSHGILGHPPMQPFDNLGLRQLNKEYENEANWLGPALLISEEAAIHIVKNKLSFEEASELYKASKEVVRMRINVTGANKRF